MSLKVWEKKKPQSPKITCSRCLRICYYLSALKLNHLGKTPKPISWTCIATFAACNRLVIHLVSRTLLFMTWRALGDLEKMDPYESGRGCLLLQTKVDDLQSGCKIEIKPVNLCKEFVYWIRQLSTSTRRYQVNSRSDIAWNWSALLPDDRLADVDMLDRTQKLQGEPKKTWIEDVPIVYFEHVLRLERDDRDEGARGSENPKTRTNFVLDGNGHYVYDRL